jgi:glycosyltransferase EpsD
VKKILFCATVDYHFKAFHLPYMEWFQEQGWEVHVAANGDLNLPFTDVKYNVPFARKPFSISNVKAYFGLKKIIKENNYDLIHFHIPVSATLGRLVARKQRKKGTKVIYTSHGHYYYKGGPKLSWLLYFPIEKFLAHFTDCLITINEEDYQLSVQNQNGASKIEKVPGMGVDLERFYPLNMLEKKVLREKYGFNQNDFILVYPAELNANKNQLNLIKGIQQLKDRIPTIRLLLPGKGDMYQHYLEYVKANNLESYVIFPGFVSNINELIQLSDLSVASSSREGLGINIVEGMACGNPVVAFDNRGHRELVEDGYNGFLIEGSNINQFSNKVLYLYKEPNLRSIMGQNSIKKANKFSKRGAVKEMTSIYQSMI